MKIGVTIPIWIQDNPALIDQTVKAASCLKSQHEIRLFVACTRLHQIEPVALQDKIQAACDFHVTVLHEPFVERSVAGAWNWGCKHALEENADYLMVTANDVEVEPGCIDELVKHGEESASSLWSGLELSQPSPAENGFVPSCCDFSCFMIRPRTIDVVGWFDERFRPAYFDDNDYYTRAILAGCVTRQVVTARFKHHGSLTIHTEPEAAHHVRFWFETNRRRYFDKWGVNRVMDTPDDILANCWRHPWNDESLPVSFCDR